MTIEVPTSVLFVVLMVLILPPWLWASKKLVDRADAWFLNRWIDRATTQLGITRDEFLDDYEEHFGPIRSRLGEG